MRFATVALVFLVLALATATLWEHQHDEGVTYDIDLAAIELPRDPALARRADLLSAPLFAKPTRGVAEVVDSLRSGSSGQPHPPLFHLVVHGVARAAGANPYVLRGPALLAGLLTLAGLMRLGDRLGRRAGGAPLGIGFAAALWLAASPWMHTITVFLRPYPLALCAAVWSAESLASGLLEPHRKGPWLRLALCLSAGLYTLYHFVFVVFALAVVGLVTALFGARGSRSLRLRGGLLAHVGALVLWAPWIPTFVRHLQTGSGGGLYYMGTVPFADWPARGTLLARRFVYAEASGPWWPIAIGLGLFGVLSVWVLLRGERPARRGLLFGLAVGGLFAFGVAAADLAGSSHTLFLSKYSFALYPFVLLASASAWCGTRRPRLGAVATVLGAALFGAASANQLVQLNSMTSGPERIAQHLTDRDREDHLIALSTSRRGLLVPLLLEASEAGVRSARWCRLDAAELGGHLANLLNDASLTELTLIDFEAGFLPPGQRFLRPSLERAMRDALEAGWRVRWYEPNVEAPRERGNPEAERVLHLFRALPARFFRA